MQYVWEWSFLVNWILWRTENFLSLQLSVVLVSQLFSLLQRFTLLTVTRVKFLKGKYDRHSLASDTLMSPHCWWDSPNLPSVASTIRLPASFIFIFIFASPSRVKVYFLAYGCSVAPTLFWKRYPSSIELLLHLRQKSTGHICVCLFLISLFCSFDLCVYLSTITKLSWLL